MIRNQELVMSHYLQAPIANGLIVSPFRVDNTPTCGFYYGSMGRLYFHDFGIEKSMDVFDVVMCKFNLSFGQAIKKIIAEKHSFTPAKVSLIGRTGTFRLVIGLESSNYFDRYYISKETLKKYSVHTLKSFYLDNSLQGTATKDDPIFAYKFSSGRFKVYRPLAARRRDKWSGNATAEDVQGIDELPYRGKLLIITSSYKDVMVLSELGFNAIAFNGEGFGTSSSKGSQAVAEVIRSLKKRFDYIIFFMDGDAPGIKYSIKLSTRYNLPYTVLMHTPYKDISDYIEKFGKHKTFRLLKKMLSKQLRYEKSLREYPTVDVPY